MRILDNAHFNRLKAAVWYRPLAFAGKARLLRENTAGISEFLGELSPGNRLTRYLWDLDTHVVGLTWAKAELWSNDPRISDSAREFLLESGRCDAANVVIGHAIAHGSDPATVALLRAKGMVEPSIGWALPTLSHLPESLDRHAIVNAMAAIDNRNHYDPSSFRKEVEKLPDIVAMLLKDGFTACHATDMILATAEAHGLGLQHIPAIANASETLEWSLDQRASFVQELARLEWPCFDEIHISLQKTIPGFIREVSPFRPTVDQLVRAFKCIRSALEWAGPASAVLEENLIIAALHADHNFSFTLHNIKHR